MHSHAWSRGWNFASRAGWQRLPHHRCRKLSGKSHFEATAGSQGAVATGGQGGWGSPLLKSAITSAVTSLAGDMIAQLLTSRQGKDLSQLPQDIDWKRAARMTGFGLCFYGPYQHWWYALLARRFPGKTAAAFLPKMAANQLILAPIVLTAIFSWNLALQGQAEKISDKMKRDMIPTMQNGWKFWIPASSLNFLLIPLQYQVLYMSTCGVAWTAYLSYSSSK